MERSVRDSVSSDCLNICPPALKKIVKGRWHGELSRPYRPHVNKSLSDFTWLPYKCR